MLQPGHPHSIKNLTPFEIRLLASYLTSSAPAVETPREPAPPLPWTLTRITRRSQSLCSTHHDLNNDLLKSLHGRFANLLDWCLHAFKRQLDTAGARLSPDTSDLLRQADGALRVLVPEEFADHKSCRWGISCRACTLATLSVDADVLTLALAVLGLQAKERGEMPVVGGVVEEWVRLHRERHYIRAQAHNVVEEVWGIIKRAREGARRRDEERHFRLARQQVKMKEDRMNREGPLYLGRERRETRRGSRLPRDHQSAARMLPHRETHVDLPVETTSGNPFPGREHDSARWHKHAEQHEHLPSSKPDQRRGPIEHKRNPLSKAELHRLEHETRDEKHKRRAKEAKQAGQQTDHRGKDKRTLEHRDEPKSTARPRRARPPKRVRFADMVTVIPI